MNNPQTVRDVYKKMFLTTHQFVHRCKRCSAVMSDDEYKHCLKCRNLLNERTVLNTNRSRDKSLCLTCRAPTETKATLCNGCLKKARDKYHSTKGNKK